jgi:hypothetical protein
MPACQIDFPGDARAIFELAHKLMTGSTGESVVAALQLQIGGADARRQHPNFREPLRHARRWPLSHFDQSVFQMYRQHSLV